MQVGISVLKFIKVPDQEHVLERAAHVASAWVSHQKKQDDFEENSAADMALLNFDWLLNFRENERVASLLNRQFYDF